MFLYTKKELNVKRKDALDELIKFAGGRAHLAKMLDKPVSTVNSWKDRGLISEDGAKDVAKHPTLAKKFTMSYLRPDLYL